MESGRALAGGRFVPWPGTLHAEGEGRVFRSRREGGSPREGVAAAEARRWRRGARGVRSVDAGRLQISLFPHHDGFQGLGAAFDPAANAR